MATNKYSYRRANGSKAKPIIIGVSAAVLVGGGILTYLAVKASDENKIAGLKYDFNHFYPTTFDTVEVIDPENDYDADGIKNGEEISHRTSAIMADTDKDSLIDSNEIYYGTEPTDSDSDGDGIKDGIEKLAGLDPLSPVSNGSESDADRKFTRTIEFDEGFITLNGGANIFGATMEQLSLNAVSSNAGAVTFPYEIYCDNGFDSATVTFRYSEALINAAEMDRDSIQIFQFDPYKKDYSTVGGVIDTENHTVSCDLEKNGVYVLGADEVIQRAAITEDSRINVHLLIDNSGSMYPKTIQSTSNENDVHFKRLSFASSFVNALDNNAQVAISAFTADTKPMIEFTDRKDNIITAINAIRTLGAGFDGTSVERALMRGLGTFTKDMVTDRNIIILLTDGISTDTAGYTLEKIVAEAQAKNVVIMTISLGDEIDRELLQNIANGTGGKYFPISDADILESLYSTMLATMKNEIVDEDYDGKPDSYTLYDTGFDIDVNAFSFGNFKSKTNQTVDFGMVALARDWFKGSVPFSVTSDDDAISYTFEGSTINTKEPLGKISLATMSASWMKPETYLNFLSGDGTLKADKKIVEEAQEMGWSTITMPYDDPNGKWQNVELLIPNHTVSRMRTKYSENDYQLIRAIHYYDSFRGKGKSFALNSETDLNKVKNVLGVGSPVITKLTWEEPDGSCKSRYVLLTTLRRSLENPNIFKLKVYDVNSKFMGDVVLTRTLKCSNIPGDDFTYSAEWDGKQAALQFYLTDVK